MTSWENTILWGPGSILSSRSWCQGTDLANVLRLGMSGPFRKQGIFNSLLTSINAHDVLFMAGHSDGARYGKC